jgi:S1-C subfamily serine protease
MHVPVDTYRDTWDRLVKSEAWGGRDSVATVANSPWMGIEGDKDDDRCTIKRIFEGSPAEKAGLKVEDIVVGFDGKKVSGFEDLPALIGKKKIGDKVTVEVLRGKESVKVELVLGKRQG